MVATEVVRKPDSTSGHRFYKQDTPAACHRGSIRVVTRKEVHLPAYGVVISAGVGAGYPRVIAIQTAVIPVANRTRNRNQQVVTAQRVESVRGRHFGGVV